MENSQVLIDANELKQLRHAAQWAQAASIHYIKTFAKLTQPLKTEADIEAEIANILKRIVAEWASNRISPDESPQ